ncbi:MAG: transglycosylase domain-containing protein [Deltaproteobacteria bacterium]|nr:transglycosylase domain-containing protein [Deltaproteobacteria bacterium]MBW1871352.1 transglycosylase domain-containing protein [Deltaproteobacteria bacterium]
MGKFLKKRKWTLITLGTLVVLALVTLWFLSGLNRALYAPQPSILILDRTGIYLGEVPASDDNLGYWPLPGRIPDKVVRATLETEDRYFYDHSGVHLPSVLRALYQNITSGYIVSGASTIAMQVARMQTPGSRNIFRKFKEAAEALCLIDDHGHDKVLRHYLTIAPYGNRVHGIVRAARYYFDKPIEDLSWLQAAFLAGLPQAPGRMDPHKPIGLYRAEKRAKLILETLYARDLISKQELDQALASDLRLVDKPYRQNQAMHAVLRWSDLAGKTGRPIVRATIDLKIQSQVAAILRKNLEQWQFRGAGNTAGLVVDVDSGEILAYVGSVDYFDKEARGAIDYVRNKRSPGSALKPFIYALAIARGLFTASSELPDIRVEFPLKTGQAYLPRNITHTFLGPMLLREALANSRNIPALRVLAALGVDQALEFFDVAGVRGVSFNPGRYGLGLVLGNLHVTLEELVGLYGCLSNGGRALSLKYFLDQKQSKSKRILPADVSQLITNILSDPMARVPSFRRGSALEYDYAVAVKTGTSQGYRDAWAVGFSDRLLVGVWLGNHDWRRMNHLGGLSGAGLALHQIMDQLMPGYEAHREVLAEFPLPKDYVSKSICPVSGKLAGPDCPHHRFEYYAPGSEPYENCAYHRKVKIDRRNGLLASLRCPSKFIEDRVLLDLPIQYERWARTQHLELAPKTVSPFCGGRPLELKPSVVIDEPKDQSRYFWDPDTPEEFSTIRLAANVWPRTEEIVWVIDGVPVAKVGYPHEFRWSLVKGKHTIEAAMLNRPNSSRPVTVVVAD